MIIFDLDGTLADCEHRRHFVDPLKAGLKWGGVEGDYKGNWTKNGVGTKWKPDWKAFYEACDKDTLIFPVWKNLITFIDMGYETQIWSGRCESVRNKTEEWLHKHLSPYHEIKFDSPIPLKMRPIGDSTLEHELKEKWFFELCKIDPNHRPPGIKYTHNINFVFDSDPDSIAMWKRRGIFVFDCCQNEDEF